MMQVKNTDRRIPVLGANPEHNRMLWLYGSPSMVLLVVALYVLPIWAAWHTVEHEEVRYLMMSQIGSWGNTISVIAIAVIIHRSLRDDINSRFWDQLRMSSLSPWQMTWPRLFTAPLLAWIGALVGAAIHAWAITRMPLDASASRGLSLSPSSGLFFWVLNVLNTVVLASWLLINGLQQIRQKTEWHGSWVQVVLLSCLVSTWSVFMLANSLEFIFEIFFNGFVRYIFGVPTAEFNDIFGNAASFKLYCLIQAALMAAVSLVGVCKSMGNKLHMTPSNKYWLYVMVAYPLVGAVINAFWSVDLAMKMVLPMCVLVYGTVALYSMAAQHCRTPDGAVSLNRRDADVFNHLPLWRFFLPLTLIAVVVLQTTTMLVWGNSGKYSSLWVHLAVLEVVYLLMYAGCKYFAEGTVRRYSAPTVSMLMFGVLYLVFFVLYVNIVMSEKISL